MIKYVLVIICLSIPMIKLQNVAIRNAIIKHHRMHGNYELIDDNQIIEYLEEGDRELRHSEQDENIFLIGLSGAEKTTTALILTDDNSKLISIDIGGGKPLGLYYIVDETGSIGNSQVHQKNVISNLLIDDHRNIAYYDCPAYDYAVDIDVDITALYFIKEIIDSSKSVKFILNINYESVNLTYDQTPIIQLLEYVSTFIVDIDKYRDAIGAVITNVDVPQIIDDNIKLGIVLFLDFVRKDLEQNINEKPFYKNGIKIIDILSQRSINNKYEKLSLLRTPDRLGPISEIPIIQNSKMNINNMIIEHIKYVKKSDNDFNYLPSLNTQNHMIDINTIMNDEVYQNTKEINDEFEKYYRHIQQNITSISNEQMKWMFTNSLWIINDFITYADKLNTPDKFMIKLNETISNVNISISNDEIMNGLIIKIDFLNFLDVVSNIEIKINAIKWVSSFQGTVQFLEDALNGLIRCHQQPESESH